MDDIENNYHNPDYNSGPIFNQKDSNVRLTFIRKVYFILSAQLLITAAFITFSVFNKNYALFLIKNVWILILCAITNITVCIALVCYKANARTFPRNFILLGIFTITEALLVSSVTAFVEPELVLLAAILTAAIVVALTIYAIKTNEDFTICGGMLFMCLMLLIVGSIICAIYPTYAPKTCLSALTIFLFGIYLIYDTQLIMGDKSNALSIDDYIIGALMLYIDIIRIFIEILKILGRSR